jgi:hypothetical protein
MGGLGLAPGTRCVASSDLAGVARLIPVLRIKEKGRLRTSDSTWKGIAGQLAPASAH